MGRHALLSASSSHRWLACPPSARLCENYGDTGSEYAQQGTDAHSLCEHKLKLSLGMETKDPTAGLSFYDEEMEECACGYAEYVLSLIEEAKKTCKDPVVLIEQRLDFSRFVEEGFGTGDCVIIADGTLYIIDYKHGKGVEVFAEGNPQMMLYALGALELFDGIYDIDAVRMAIYQPRRENVSVYAMAKDDLLQWAEGELKEKAKLAYAGEGEFCAGEHCKFCKAKAVCRKREEYNLELAKYDFEMPATLEDDEIAAILVKADELAAWAADVKEFALQQALSGVKYAGFKVVAGRSNRKYTDEDAVADTVKKAGFDPYEPKLLGIIAMEKLLGRKKFADILKGLVEKPIKAAYREGEAKLKGNGRSVPALSVLKTPLRDGDVERPDDEAYADSYFVNANSSTAPGIVDADRQPILDHSEVYSGVYGRASINFYAFNSNGNKGIACGLNNLQKIRDGEPLGGRSRAEDDFADEAGDDEDFLS